MQRSDRAERVRRSTDLRLASFFRAVWALDQGEYKDLAWTQLSAPEVRIAFAQFWGQYVRSTTGDRGELASTHKYAEPFISHPNDDIRRDAVAYIGALGTPADEERLTEICSRDVFSVAVTAAHGLGWVLGARARPALERCMNATTNDRLRDAVSGIVKSLPKSP